MSTQEMPLDGLDLLGRPIVAAPLVTAPLLTAPTVAAPARLTPAQPGPARPVPLHEPEGPRFAVWARRYVAALRGWDVLVGATAALVPSVVSETLSSSPLRIAVLCAIGAVVWPLAVASMKGYQRRAVGVGSDEVHAVLRAWVAVVVAGAVSAELVPALVETERDALLKLAVTGTPFAVALSVGGRFAARKFLHREQRAGRLVRRVVVAGSAAAASQLIERLSRDAECGMAVVGVCVPDAELADLVGLQVPVLGDLRHVGTALKEHSCDTVAVTSDDATRFTYLRELSWALEGSGVEMLVDPGLVEVAGPRMHIRPVIGLPLLQIEKPEFSGGRRLLKGFVDRTSALLGLVLLSPVLIVLFFSIRLKDNGPAFFRQTRVGKDGTEFRIWKFRSMFVDAETRLAAIRDLNENADGLLFKVREDPRVTPIGRFIRRYSLDELPQLFNVLNGTMSLVGPRPPLPSEVAEYGFDVRRRLLVRPGLTGLWQVSGRSDLSWEESVRLDLRYVENWSLGQDALILWKTASAVLRGSGAY